MQRCLDHYGVRLHVVVCCLVYWHVRSSVVTSSAHACFFFRCPVQHCPRQPPFVYDLSTSPSPPTSSTFCARVSSMPSPLPPGCLDAAQPTTCLCTQIDVRQAKVVARMLHPRRHPWKLHHASLQPGTQPYPRCCYALLSHGTPPSRTTVARPALPLRNADYLGALRRSAPFRAKAELMFTCMPGASSARRALTRASALLSQQRALLSPSSQHALLSLPSMSLRTINTPSMLMYQTHATY